MAYVSQEQGTVAAGLVLEAVNHEDSPPGFFFISRLGEARQGAPTPSPGYDWRVIWVTTSRGLDHHLRLSVDAAWWMGRQLVGAISRLVQGAREPDELYPRLAVMLGSRICRYCHLYPLLCYPRAHMAFESL
jgi:hypothetical protein